MKKLEDIRQVIDGLDNTIIENLSKRFDAVNKVAKIKKEQNLSIFDIKREKEIIEKIQKKEINCAFEISEIYGEIMRISRKYQAKQLLPHNIFLIGFMGAGKSTTGKILSQITGFEFLDTDQMIEEKEQMKISDIFSQKGQSYFRELETQVLREIKEDRYQIISCGGGIILKDENRSLLKEKGNTVLLKGSADTLLNRLKSNKDRPLFSAMQQDEGKQKEEFKELLESRKQYYIELADIIIKIEDKTPEEIANEVLKDIIQFK